MRTAVIDLGTNTFNLLVVEETPSGFIILYSGKEAVKLREEGIINGFLSDPAVKRAVKAIRNLLSIAGDFQVNRILAFGTSALRNAGNTGSILEQLKREFGFEVEIISGEEEAELIYQGVVQALPLDGDTALILDIGGGSNEFILCNGNGILWKKSYEMGMARLLEQFRPSDPMTSEEEKNIRRYLKAGLTELFEQTAIFRPVQMIGASGSFDTLRSILAEKLGRPEENRLRPYAEINPGFLAGICREIIQASLAERLKIPGMEPVRAEMMGLACILIDLVLQETGIRRLVQTDYSLKEGVVTRKLNGKIFWNRHQ